MKTLILSDSPIYNPLLSLSISSLDSIPMLQASKISEQEVSYWPYDNTAHSTAAEATRSEPLQCEVFSYNSLNRRNSS